MQLSSRQHMRQLFVSLEKDAEVILPRKRNANICRPGSRLLHAVCRIDVYDDVLAVQEYQPVLVSEVVVRFQHCNTTRVMIRQTESVDAAREHTTDNTTSRRLRTAGNFSFQDLQDSANIGPRRDLRVPPHRFDKLLEPCRECAPKTGYLSFAQASRGSGSGSTARRAG